MKPTAGRALAAIGAVLAIVAVWLDALAATPPQSYWDLDVTLAAFGLGAAILALLFAAASFAGRATDGWLFATGALLLGYYAWFPAYLAFSQWDQTKVGLWLALAGAALITIGAAGALLSTGGPASTPARLTPPMLFAGIGIALCIPGIFLYASSDTSYWNGPFGHWLGIVMLAVTILASLTWTAAYGGAATHGLDLALGLVLLGLMASEPIGSAFDHLGDLQIGAWLGLLGGILAAGGTWAARRMALPDSAAAPA